VISAKKLDLKFLSYIEADSADPDNDPDQAYRDHPIYCDATPPEISATLCSALFDFDRRQLRIYWGHPVKEPEQYLHFDL
jgi:hypothetical protein